MDVRFVRVGNDYLNAVKIERFLVFEDEACLSVASGREFTIPHDPDKDGNAMMTRVTRKITETSYDIIYVESTVQNGEDVYSEDQASNLLYRQWLERRELFMRR